MKSSRKTAYHILGVLTTERAENILKDFANLPGQLPLIDNPKPLALVDASIKRLCSRHAHAFEDCPPIPLLTLRDLARKAWTAADPRAAEWYLFRFRHLLWETLRRVRDVRESEKPEREIPGGVPASIKEGMQLIAHSEPPPVTELEAAAFYLQKNLYRALFCPNAECPAPYFFASKKGQKFCSPECALPARRASKLKWWNENRGEKRRKQK